MGGEYLGGVVGNLSNLQNVLPHVKYVKFVRLKSRTAAEEDEDNEITASTTELPGAMEVEDRSTGNSTMAQREAQFELAITLTLFLWPSLSLAVANNWGGPDSAAKREMFASATIDLLKETPDADEPWIEEFLLQVMLDEFEVAVDDGSAGDVADDLVRLRRECGRGDFSGVGALRERWERTGGRSVGAGFATGEDEDGETSGSEDGEEEEEGYQDVDMDEAPQLVRTREPVVPEVDEDGFTKVTKKKQ